MKDRYYSGFALHFCGGSDCAFHIGTIVGDWIVSTVGAYLPKGCKEIETIGSGENDFYETAVCRCDGLDENLNPVTTSSWEIVERYGDSRDAERGHHRICDEKEAEES